MTGLVWPALAMMTLLGAVGSLMLKLASGADSLRALATSPRLWAGAAAYGSAALLNIWVLRHLDLSVVLPMTAFTYVWTMVLGRLVLGETVHVRKLTGVALIGVGVVLIAVA